jgi:hypothetical protein
MELLHSLRHHGAAIVKYWWALLVGGVFGALGVYTIVSHDDLRGVSTLHWFLLALLCLIVAQFLAFSDVRRERDAAIKSKEDFYRRVFPPSAPGIELEGNVIKKAGTFIRIPGGIRGGPIKAKDNKMDEVGRVVDTSPETNDEKEKKG